MQWEYKTIKLATKGLLGGKLDTGKLDAFMNDLGAAGWELVTGFDTNRAYGETRDVVVLFKRLRQKPMQNRQLKPPAKAKVTKSRSSERKIPARTSFRGQTEPSI